MPKKIDQTQKFISLAKRHISYRTNETLNNLIESFENIPLEILAKENKEVAFIFNELPEDFYKYLAESFISDLNTHPEIWLINQQLIYYIISNEKASYLNRYIEVKAAGSFASDLYIAIKCIKYESYEMALEYLNKHSHYIVDFFIGICQIEFGNLHNGIIRYLNFEKKIYEFIQNIKHIDLNNNITLNFQLWNIKIELITLFNRCNDYQKAIDSFNECLKIYDLKETYLILNEKNNNSNRTDFEIIVNHYIFSLEKLNQFDKAIRFIEDVILYADSIFYRKWKNKLQKKHKVNPNVSFLKLSRKPFNLSEFYNSKTISKEKNLEDLIIEQIKYGYKVFGKNLEVYNTDKIFGRQYYIKEINGFLDLLLIDKSENTLYLIELKRNEGGIEVYQQILNYMTAMKKEVNLPIKGIICLHKPTDDLKELITNSNEKISLFEYNFNFKKLA